MFDDVRYDVQMNQTCVYESTPTKAPTSRRQEVRGQATTATVRRSRAATSRSPRSIRRRTCAPRCCPPSPTWASRSRSTITRWRRASMSWASSSHAGEVRRRHDRSTSTSCTTSRMPTARPRPSCRSRSRATTARACTCHQSIWKDGKPLFAGNGYADLSEMALYYIGGIIKHAKAINAFTNPTTNSYKRLIPGFEAPVLLAYSSRNRSASCRIPYVASPKGKRVEVRFPDPSANPYLAFCGDADGRPRRHPEQDPSRRPDGQEPLRPAAGRAEERADGLRLAARGARHSRRPTTPSCRRATCSPTTSSTATSS